jgi:hypothetical protein
VTKSDWAWITVGVAVIWLAGVLLEEQWKGQARLYAASRFVVGAIFIAGCTTGVLWIVTTPAAGHRCDPNYSGACLKPNAGDYDCANGPGDGPNYVEGPVTVKGTDVYNLDADRNGIGCQ